MSNQPKDFSIIIRKFKKFIIQILYLDRIFNEFRIYIYIFRILFKYYKCNMKNKLKLIKKKNKNEKFYLIILLNINTEYKH